MRKYLGLAIAAGALVAVAGACSTANKGGPDGRITGPNGSSGTGNGSAGFGTGNIGTGPDINPGNPNGMGGAPTDPDPSNPNITHALCQPGTCADFPKDPIKGENLPANVEALFGDPTNFTAGALCVLEPQLSNGDKPGAM